MLEAVGECRDGVGTDGGVIVVVQGVDEGGGVVVDQGRK